MSALARPLRHIRNRLRSRRHLVGRVLSDYSAQEASALLPAAGSPMRRLLLLRHAKTEASAPSGRDVDRRLDGRGPTDAAEIGGWLARQGDAPARVLVSPAVRARQTWEIIAPLLGSTPETVEEESLYNASPSELLTAIRHHGADAPSLMVVAHNPGLHELGLALTQEGARDARRALEDNLPTSGLIILDFDIADWGGAGFRRGTLQAFVTPKTLREADRDGA